MMLYKVHQKHLLNINSKNTYLQYFFQAYKSLEKFKNNK